MMDVWEMAVRREISSLVQEKRKDNKPDVSQLDLDVIIDTQGWCSNLLQEGRL